MPTPSADSAQLVLDARAELGEGPLWDPCVRRLFWVDILAGRLHAFDPASGADRSWLVGDRLGMVAPRARGGLVLALRDQLAAFDPERAEVPPAPLARPPVHPPGNRFNDGKCDPAGRLWVGTKADDNAAGAGTLWRFSGDGRAEAMVTAVTISNGLAWDVARRRFYYIDTPTRTVAAYDYDPDTGAIANRRVAIAVGPEDGFPDGMTIDEDGMLWIAHWGGHQVIRWNPDSGRALRRIRLPVSQPSCCAFGGEQLDRLYITSARENLGPDQLAAEPLAGGLFVAEPGVRGFAPNACAL
jgi:sugar lactone lactonase YvrE